MDIFNPRFPNELSINISLPFFAGPNLQDLKEIVRQTGISSPLGNIRDTNQAIYFEETNLTDECALGVINYMFCSPGCSAAASIITVDDAFGFDNFVKLTPLYDQPGPNILRYLAVQTVLKKGTLWPKEITEYGLVDRILGTNYSHTGGAGINFYDDLPDSIKQQNPFNDLMSGFASVQRSNLQLTNRLPDYGLIQGLTTTFAAVLADPNFAAGQNFTTPKINNHSLDFGFYMSNLIPPFLKLHCRELSQKSQLPSLCVTQLNKKIAMDENFLALSEKDYFINGKMIESKDETVVAIIPMDTAWAGGEDTLKSNILTYQPPIDRVSMIPIMNATFREFTWWLTDDNDNILTFPRQKPVVDFFLLD
jgi:hypothetical protein